MVKVEKLLHFGLWDCHLENRFISFTTNGTIKPYIRRNGPQLKHSLLGEKQRKLNLINMRKMKKIKNEHERSQ